MDSGKGLYLIAKIDAPPDFGRDYKRLLTYLQEQLQQKEMGFKVDCGVHNIDRVGRIAGTLNRKHKKAKPCEVKRYGKGEPLNIEDLRAIIDPLPIADKSKLGNYGTLSLYPKPPKQTYAPASDWESKYFFKWVAERWDIDSTAGVADLMNEAGLQVIEDTGEGVFIVSPKAGEYTTPRSDRDLIVHPRLTYNGFHAHDAHLWDSMEDFFQTYLPDQWHEFQTDLSKAQSEHKQSEHKKSEHKQSEHKKSEHGTTKYPSHMLRSTIIRASDVKEEAIEWLWEDRIPLGMLTLIYGDGGTGKGYLTCDIAARVTTGKGFPDTWLGNNNAQYRPRNVVMMGAEDAISKTLVPRLRLAGADMEKVHFLPLFLKDTPVDLHNIPLLEDCIKTIGDVGLLIVDPVSEFMGDTNPNANNEVKMMLAPVREMAERTNVAVVIVNHVNKGRGGSASDRVMGSAAFRNTCRIAYTVAKTKADPDRRVFAPDKANICNDTGGLAFRVRAVEDKICRVEWEESAATETADELYSAEPMKAPALEDAKDFLLRVLADGPRLTAEIRKEADRLNIAKKTLDNAKRSLGVTHHGGPNTAALLSGPTRTDGAANADDRRSTPTQNNELLQSSAAVLICPINGDFPMGNPKRHRT